MSEETHFEKKTTLKDEDMLKLLNDRKADALAIHFWPDNTQAFFKILEEPKVFGEEDPDSRPAAYWKVSWKYKDQPVEIKIRTSKGAYDSFMEKFNKEKFEYIGKYCIFAKGKNEKGIYHSVSRPMQSEPQTFVDPLDAIKDIEAGKFEEPKVNTEELQKRASDFVNEFMQMVGQVNKQKEEANEPKIVPSVELACAKYMRTHYRDEFDAIKDCF